MSEQDIKTTQQAQATNCRYRMECNQHLTKQQRHGTSICFHASYVKGKDEQDINHY
jgi:hypothetical protein